MQTFVPLLAAAALIYATANLVKEAIAGNGKVVLTQLVTWCLGVIVVVLLAMTDFASSIVVGEDPGWVLSDLNGFSLILLGVSMAGVGNVIYDVIPKSTTTIGEG